MPVLIVSEKTWPQEGFQEALIRLLVRHDDAELERVFDRLEPDRHRCALLFVERDERAQVDVAQRISEMTRNVSSNASRPGTQSPPCRGDSSTE
jgi:hypothetical protein